jgi:hypothetical protein
MFAALYIPKHSTQEELLRNTRDLRTGFHEGKFQTFCIIQKGFDFLSKQQIRERYFLCGHDYIHQYMLQR